MNKKIINRIDGLDNSLDKLRNQTMRFKEVMAISVNDIFLDIVNMFEDVMESEDITNELLNLKIEAKQLNEYLELAI